MMDSPTTSGDAHTSWGGPQEMSAWDAIMWRAGDDPRTTSTGMLVELLESEPEWVRFVAAHQKAIHRIPRLRERVVQPTLPIVQPAWSPDPHFDLTHHVRSVNLGGSGTRSDLMQLCERLWTTALDRNRPPWVATLVTGMADGAAAYVFKVHHALTDGMGLVQLLELTHTEDADPAPGDADATTPVMPVRPPVTSSDLLVRGVVRRATEMPAIARSALGRGRQALLQPRRSVVDAIDYSRSLNRLLGAMPERSPLLASTGPDNRLLLLDVQLSDLKAAGRAAGGSVNDAYLAAVLGGLRLFHEKHGATVERIPIAMPVSLRASGDPGGGNKFAGVRFSAPLAEPDPAVRIRMVGEFVRDVRTEPAIAYLDSASAALSKLPDAAIIELTARATAAADLQISNIPGLRKSVHLAGARVTGTYPLGPRPGVAAMVTMLTYNGLCCVGLNVDANVFPSVEILHECLEAGFAEVLDLARPVAAEQ